MVVVLGNLGSYGVILSMICLAVPIYYDMDRVLPYHSCNRERQSFWDRKRYLCLGRNVDSYLLLQNACIKFGFVAFVYGVTSFLFVAYGEMSFRMVFNLAFGVYTVGLFSSTLVKIRRSNPKFQNTLIGFCIALMVVCGSLMLFFWSGAGNTVRCCLGFLSVAIFCIPMFVYPKRVKSYTKYKILLCGGEEDVKSFRIVTEGGRSYKLGKELLYPVQQDSGDYFLFLVDGNFAVIPEKEAKIKLKQER